MNNACLLHSSIFEHLVLDRPMRANWMGLPGRSILARHDVAGKDSFRHSLRTQRGSLNVVGYGPPRHSEKLAQFMWHGIVLLVLLLRATTVHAEDGYAAFVGTRERARIGMSVREIFLNGLADYLVLMKVKNIPGATLPMNQPVSSACARHVLDISYFSATPKPGKFWVRVYCNQNEPSAGQAIPERSFSDKDSFLGALDASYGSWAKSMSFRVESPPTGFGGVYDYYEFTTDEAGKINFLSSIVKAK